MNAALPPDAPKTPIDLSGHTPMMAQYFENLR
jgi:hypothetical protein